MSIIKNKRTGRKTTGAGKYIAAIALSAATLMTVATAANGLSGSFDAAMAEYFAEEAAEDVYKGSKVVCESDKTDMEFLGISGDNNVAFGLIRFTAPDGESFIDDKSGCYILYDWETDNGMFAGRKKTPAEIALGKVFNPPVVTAEYSFEDEKNILLEFRYFGEDGENPKGKTVELSCKEIRAVRPVKTVYTPDVRDGLAEFSFDSGGRMSWYFPETLINSLRHEYADEISGNMDIVRSQDGNSLVLAQVDTISLDYSFSVKMDYRSRADVHFGDALVYDEKNVAWTVNSIDAHPMTLELDISTIEAETLKMPTAPDASGYMIGEPAEDGTMYVTNEYYIRMAEFDRAYEELFEELDITLRDGETVRAVKADEAYSSFMESGKYEIHIKAPYFYYKDGKQISVDPSAIEKISWNGNTISA